MAGKGDCKAANFLGSDATQVTLPRRGERLDYAAMIGARHRRSRRAAASLLIASLAAAAANADGVYDAVPLRGKEPHDLIETADQFHEQFERRSLLHADEAVLDLVRRVGERIAPPPLDDYVDYRFYVLRDPSPNAFAMPNGRIYVHTGMLARLADEAQLAGLLGHEVNHVAGHHGLLQYRITAKKILIDIFGGSLASVLTQLRFSRELEQEADDRAAALAQAAGYDPHALPELFDILAEDFEGLRPRIATIWTTHPDPEDRAAKSRALVAELPSGERRAAEYDAVMYPLRAMTVRDYIQDDFPYTAIALAQTYIEKYPDALEFRQLLGDAWQKLGPRSEFLPEDLTNRDRRRNLRQRVLKTRTERTEALLATEEGREAFAANMGRARSAYEEIIALDPEYAPAHRGRGEVLEALGEPREAARAYLEYLRLAPEATDRPVIVARLAALRDVLQRGEVQ